jgi:hypothetical protein
MNLFELPEREDSPADLPTLVRDRLGGSLQVDAQR